MKRQILYIGLLIVALGCNNAQKKPTHDSNNENVILADTIKKPRNSMIYDSHAALWAYDFDESTNSFKPIKLREFNSDTLTPIAIEKIINRTWPKVQIQYIKTNNDTIVISIPKSEVLTQQMGTTGADQFMFSTTYSFTELTDVNYVKYEFDIGDHANPGVYNRESWNEE